MAIVKIIRWYVVEKRELDLRIVAMIVILQSKEIDAKALNKATPFLPVGAISFDVLGSFKIKSAKSSSSIFDVKYVLVSMLFKYLPSPVVKQRVQHFVSIFSIDKVAEGEGLPLISCFNC